MNYTVQQLAQLAGVSSRTLRYYDQIGLLPAQRTESGYRLYGTKEVDLLQQILFYRSLGMSLDEIRQTIHDPSFDRHAALQSHLQTLISEKEQLEQLIRNVQKTIEKEEGKRIMTDREKFEGFKQDLIDKNEEQYGKEIREKYGNKTVDESNKKLLHLSEEEYDVMSDLTKKINVMLEKAVKDGISPQSDCGKEIALSHKQWLSYTWPSYSIDAHIGLVNMYLADERFKAYYDGNVDGCALFLKQAVEYHLGGQTDAE